MSIVDSLTPELQLLVRWVKYQIDRNSRGDGSPDPLFQESRDLLEAKGVWVGWDHESKKVRILAVLPARRQGERDHYGEGCP